MKLPKGLDRPYFVPAEEDWWRRSHLITSCHNLWDWTQSSPGPLLPEKELTSTISPDLHFPLDLCCFSQALFFPPVIYIFIRADRSLTSFNFSPLSSQWAERKWAVMWRTVRMARDFGRWEICWGSIFIWKCGHKFLPLLLSLTHCHAIPSSTQPPPSLLFYFPDYYTFESCIQRNMMTWS